MGHHHIKTPFDIEIREELPQKVKVPNIGQFDGTMTFKSTLMII